MYRYGVMYYLCSHFLFTHILMIFWFLFHIWQALSEARRREIETEDHMQRIGPYYISLCAPVNCKLNCMYYLYT